YGTEGCLRRAMSVGRKLMRRVIAGLCVALLGLSGSAFAQRTTGMIVGTVTDESGAVLPGVTVTASGPDVQGQPPSSPGSSGSYLLPPLVPGTYTLNFELAGFATLTRQEVVVPLGGTIELNVQ